MFVSILFGENLSKDVQRQTQELHENEDRCYFKFLESLVLASQGSAANTDISKLVPFINDYNHYLLVFSLMTPWISLAF